MLLVVSVYKVSVSFALIVKGSTAIKVTRKQGDSTIYLLTLKECKALQLRQLIGDAEADMTSCICQILLAILNWLLFALSFLLQTTRGYIIP